MAKKSKTVIALLATAVALAGTIENAELDTHIKALQDIDEANGNTQEYKDLKALLETIDAKKDADGANDAKDEDASDIVVAIMYATSNGGKLKDFKSNEQKEYLEYMIAQYNVSDAEKTPKDVEAYNELVEQLKVVEQAIADAKDEADEKLEAEKNAKKVKPKKLSYAGVRMIGSKWYCKQDNYKQGFSTADECAKHFNK